jgi:hypothetical protein
MNWKKHTKKAEEVEEEWLKNFHANMADYFNGMRDGLIRAYWIVYIIF